MIYDILYMILRYYEIQNEVKLTVIVLSLNRLTMIRAYTCRDLYYKCAGTYNVYCHENGPIICTCMGNVVGNGSVAKFSFSL